MKLRTLLILAVVVVMASCSKDALDVTFDANYETDLSVNVPASKAQTGTFHVIDTIDLQSDAEVQKYLAQIKEWNLKGFEGTFKNLSKEFTLISGKLNVESGGRNAEWLFNNVNITEAHKIVFGNENSQFDVVNQILSDKGTFILSFEGETSEKDLTFDMGALMKTEVTANPLD